MNGFLLLLPFFIIRFPLMSALSGRAIRRAAHFAPMQGTGKAAYFVYQASNIGIFLYLAFLSVKVDFSWKFYAGSAFYLFGLILCAAAVAAFSRPDSTGMNTNGVYRISRNPMYVAYFICFIGMALLTQSLALLGIVLVFQVSAHWIILAEETWCIAEFGIAYRAYMGRVRRCIQAASDRMYEM